MPESHFCKDCFFNRMQNNLEKGENYCNLFLKVGNPDTTICINYASAQDVAEAIIRNNAISKDAKVDFVYRIISNQLEKKHLMAINEAVLQTNEIKDFEIKFERLCESKIQEFDNGEKLVARKPTSGQIEPGWDKTRVYKETRVDKDGKPYVRKLKISMATNGLNDCEILENLSNST